MRPIDADALLKKQTTIRVTYHCQGADEWDDYEAVLVKDINNAPTLSPDEVRGVGKWITKENGKVWWYECSCCHERPLISRFGDMENLSAYCPYCGARMKGGAD